MQAPLTLADGRGSSAAPLNRPSPSTVPAPAPAPASLPSLPPPPRPSLSSLSLISANVHGINDASRRSGLFRGIAAHAPDVICLQETKLAESETFIQSLWNGSAFWGCGPDSGQGTAILFPTLSKAHPNSTDAHSSSRSLLLPFTWNQEKFLLVNAYAPNCRVERKAFFENLADQVTAHPALHDPETLLILCGDFNCVADPEMDKLGGDLSPATFPPALIELIAQEDLVDAFRSLHPNKREFTHESLGTSTRLDYVLMSRSLLHRAHCVHVDLPLSDHDLVHVILEPKTPVERGMSPWTLPTYILNHRDFKKALKQELDALKTTDFLDPNGWFSALLERIRRTAVTYTMKLAQKRLSTIEAYQARLRHLKGKLLADPTHPTLRRSIRAVKKAIHKEADRVHALARAASQARFHALGEKATRYFAHFAKKRVAQSTILALTDDTGTSHTTLRGIKETAREFYTSLYSAQPTDPPSQALLLDKLHRRLLPEDARRLDLPISAEEVSQAIAAAPKGKSPGPDGLPAEIWPLVPDAAPNLATLFNHWLLHGVPEQHQEGIVTLLFKKGAPDKVSNYRPITLLSSAYKLMTKVLTNRLNQVMHIITSPSQTGIKGRYIGTSIRTLVDTMRFLTQTKTAGGILLLDQEKAFDKVDWTYLVLVLERLGFGPSFLSWIRVLYSTPTSKLKVNCSLSDSFQLKRGVRQGDPLSPLLFVLAMEPLVCAIEQDSTLAGIKLPDRSSLKNGAYADDLAVFISSTADLARAEFWMSTYEQATGATFNRAKCEAILYRLALPDHSTYFPNFKTDPAYSFTYLGCPCSFSPSPTAQWEQVLAKFKATLDCWNRHRLSLTGKTTVLTTFAIPQLTYLASFLPAPPAVLDRVHDLAWKFLWNGKKAKVNLDTCVLPKLLGGLGYPSLPDMITTLHAKWMSRLLAAWDSDLPWVALAKWSLENVGAKWGYGLTCLMVPGTKYDADRALSPFWASCLSSFWKLNPHHQLDANLPHSRTLALSTPLFGNPTIKADGKILNTNRWLPWAKAGIVRMTDIVFWDHIGTLEEISDYHHTSLTKASYELLMSALPDDLIELCCSPRLVTGSYWGEPRGDHHLVARILPDPNKILAWKLHPDRTVTNPGIFHLDDPASLRPVIFNADAGLLHYLDVASASPGDIFFGNDNVRAATATNKDIRAALPSPSTIPKHEPDWPHGNWDLTYRRLWSSSVPNKWKDTFWLLLRQSHFLGENSQKQDWDGIPHHCSHCPDHLETHAHTFITCPAARLCWKWCAVRWRKLTRLPSPVTAINIVHLVPPSGPRKRKKELSSAWTALVLTTAQAIWKARCSSVFDSLAAPIHLLPPLLQHLISLQPPNTNQHPTIWGVNNAFGRSLPGGHFTTV